MRRMILGRVFILCSVILCGQVIIDNVNAENINYEVVINPSMQLIIPNSVSLDLSPIGTGFNSKDLSATVATNNKAGYSLIITSEKTDLVRTEALSDNTTPTIPTLVNKEGGYTESDFLTNSWGIKLSNTNYLPYVRNIEVGSSNGPTNGNTSVVTFGAKVDASQPVGRYEIDLNFVTVAKYSNIEMQNLNPSFCTSAPTYVEDSRDHSIYLIQRLADGKCWMLDNLGFSDTSYTMTAGDTNIQENTTYKLPADANEWSNIFTSAKAIGTNKSTVMAGYGVGSGKRGTYYNYCAASAGTYCYDMESGAGDAEYDICPAGWRLPTSGTSGELASLFKSYSKGREFRDALALNLAGNINETLDNENDMGFWWSSTFDNVKGMKVLGRYPDMTYYDNYYFTRNYAVSIRCVMKEENEQEEIATLNTISTLQEASNEVCRNTSIGTVATVNDSRDGQQYQVGKLADGNCWMLDNLRLGSVELAAPLSVENTNMNPSVAFTLPESSSIPFGDAQKSIPLINTSAAQDELGNSYYYGEYGARKIGTFFNFCAVTAGTYCASVPSDHLAKYDVCPRGWHLPSGGTGGEYSNLRSMYDSDLAFLNASAIAKAGYMQNTSRYAGEGWYWTTNGNGWYNGVITLIQSDGSVVFDNLHDRSYGFSARCMINSN